MENLRYQKLKGQMEKDGLDILIVCSPENSYYYSGTYIVTQTTLRERMVLSVFSLMNDPVFIACSVEKTLAQSETWIADQRYYTEFIQSPVMHIIDILKTWNYKGKRIGLEIDYLSVKYYRELVEALPDAVFVSCTDTLKRVRMIKEPEEIRKISEAALRMTQSIELAISETSVGDTEKKLDERIKHHLLSFGAQDFTFFTMGTGPKSLLVHALPDETFLTSGEIMRLDYGARFDLYNADIARTVSIGKENPEYLDIFKRLCDVYYDVVTSLKAGISTKELFETCKNRAISSDLTFAMPHIGHALGIDLHEEPMLSPAIDFYLEENMIFNIEPLITYNGRLYHIEDTILIKKNGFEVLSQPKFDPHILHIL